MNRIIHKSSGQQSSAQQLQQMLSRSSIQAQEQQVTSLRELLRQEESRLELLKKMRQPTSGGAVKDTQRTGGSGVIKSGDTPTHHLNNGMLPIIVHSIYTMYMYSTVLLKTHCQ